ncbi:zinc ribbon domain-containing protein [Clostridium saudiense]|nr:zinc ribbon domain-containing protein [Clostridium saudiense]
MSATIFMFIPLIFMAIIFGLFIWQAIWVAMDSRKRGEEYWWLWTIAAFIAFPVGIIVYAIVSRSDRRRCNNCGKEVPKDLKLCPYCGQRCGNFCPNCGQNVQSGWRFCPNCTTELPDEIANSKRKINNKPIIIVVSIIVVLAILFVGMFVVSYTSFSGISNSYVEEINTFDTSGYQGEVFDSKTTEVLTYDIPSNTHSFWYKGEREKGYLLVKVYDKDGNLKKESDKISAEEFTEGMFVEPGQKIEVYLNDYKGSFYVRFN